jgi:DnaJ homolog subfamily C member 28
MSDKRPEPGWNPWLPPTREALIDRQIREAQEAGAFDDLPFQGEPLPLVDDSAAGDWALAYRMLKGSNFAPPWIETDKEIRALLGQREAILERATRASAIGRARDRGELQRVVESANRAITRLNHEAPTYRQHRRLLDLDQELEDLARAHDPEDLARAHDPEG